MDVTRCKNLKNLHAKSQLSSFNSFRDLRADADGRMDMGSSTRLVILIKNKTLLST